ncbi:MAG: Dihydrofolate reductase, partial [uncultured Gemmatimonadaceae bacterium]
GHRRRDDARPGDRSRRRHAVGRAGRVRALPAARPRQHGGHRPPLVRDLRPRAHQRAHRGGEPVGPGRARPERGGRRDDRRRRARGARVRPPGVQRRRRVGVRADHPARRRDAALLHQGPLRRRRLLPRVRRARVDGGAARGPPTVGARRLPAGGGGRL